jgi:hypothetical protein
MPVARHRHAHFLADHFLPLVEPQERRDPRKGGVEPPALADQQRRQRDRAEHERERHDPPDHAKPLREDQHDYRATDQQIEGCRSAKDVSHAKHLP